MIGIRAAAPGDATALAALAIETYTQAFGASMSAADLAAHLNQHLQPGHFAQALEHDTIGIAERAGKLLGFVQCGPHGEAEGEQELRRLYVDAGMRNKGLGSRLLEWALALPRMRAAQRVVLDVWEHNPGAQRLYTRYGFQVVGERRFAVESGGPTSMDLIMVREQ